MDREIYYCENVIFSKAISTFKATPFKMSNVLFEDLDNLLLKLMLIKESSRTKTHTKIHNME